MKNNFKMRLIFITLIQLLLCNFLQAQISGVVLDNQRKPIEFANVMLCNSTGNCIKGTTTDEKGNFKILTNELDSDMYIEVSFIGYKEKKMQNIRKGKTIHVTLEEDSKLLKEVVVRGSVSPIKMKSGSIVADVAGSILSREVSIKELLRKIPGMMLKNDKLTSFFGGTTLIYINGRKISSLDEINQIEVKNIKNIELNTNPGSEYDASIGAIINIKTRKRLEGFSMQGQNMFKKGHRYAHSEAIQANYNTKGLNVFGTIYYIDWKRRLYHNGRTIMYTKKTKWTRNSNSYAKNNIYKNLCYSLGFNYDISNNRKLGFKYYRVNSDYRDDGVLKMQLYEDDKLYNDLSSSGDMISDCYSDHFNAYYKDQLSKGIKLEVYADYMNSNKKRDQDSEEYGIDKIYKYVTTNNKSNYKLLAINPKIRYKINASNKISLGLEYSKINGEAELRYSNSIQGSKTETKEDKFSGFVDYSYSSKKLNISAGLRYEKLKSNLDDFINPTNSKTKRYGNFFPSLNISYKTGSISNNLSFRSGIKRPSFSILSNYSYYKSQYLLFEGNPAVKSQLFYKYEYSFLYKWFLLKMGYTYNKDYINKFMYMYSQDKPIIMTTWKNYNKEETLNLMCNLRPHFGFYEPSLTISFQRHFLDFNVSNNIKLKNKPSCYVDFNNDFKLPKNILFNLEYEYTNGGTSDLYLLGETHALNTKIQKSFLRGNLILSFIFKDIFNSNRAYNKSALNNIYSREKCDSDSFSYYSLNLVWRFNNYKNKYRGRSAARDQMNRL
ncbi:MAG: outer membrane beta-barrel protein [Marinifilaceae bacterium]|nr:outer membrane beta-barrel protein [Marinifilaceae bacterium]